MEIHVTITLWTLTEQKKNDMIICPTDFQMEIYKKKIYTFFPLVFSIKQTYFFSN